MLKFLLQRHLATCTCLWLSFHWQVMAERFQLTIVAEFVPQEKTVQYLTGCPRPLMNGVSKAVIHDSNFVSDSHCGRILGRCMLKLVHWNLVVFMRCTANLFCVASFPGSPMLQRWRKIRRGRTWYPFMCDVVAQQHLGFNELIGYITTRVCWLLCQQQTNRGKIIPMAMMAEKITLWHRQLGIPVQSNLSYKCNLLVSDCSGTRISSRKLMGTIYCIACSFTSTSQDL